MMQTWNDPAALAGADRAGVIEAAKLDALDHNSSKHPVQQRDREIDLTGEWLAAGRLDGGWRTWLRRQGVPGSALLKAPTQVALQRIAAERGQFRPDADGIDVMMLAIWDYPPFRDPDAAIIDLVAWRPDCPSVWWLRTGSAIALGEWLIGPGSLADGPVAVHRTPMDWLRAAGDGVCLLTGDQGERATILRDLPGIAVDDVKHGRELDVLMRQPVGRIPPIYVHGRAAA